MTTAALYDSSKWSESIRFTTYVAAEATPTSKTIIRPASCLPSMSTTFVSMPVA